VINNVVVAPTKPPPRLPPTTLAVQRRKLAKSGDRYLAPGRLSCGQFVLFQERERSGPKAAPLSLPVSECLLHALEDGGDAHAPADAEGDETVLAARAREVVQDLDGQDGAGGPDRVP